jgi:hypothetical protein
LVQRGWRPPWKLSRITNAVRPETIAVGSGMAEAPIVTVPGVLVNGTTEVSVPVEKLNTSKKVDVLELIEPSPVGGTRLIVYESPARGEAREVRAGHEVGLPLVWVNAASRIVDVVSDVPFDRFVERRLFGPLGMKDTTFYLTEQQLPRFATSYRRNK